MLCICIVRIVVAATNGFLGFLISVGGTGCRVFSSLICIDSTDVGLDYYRGLISRKSFPPHKTT